MDDLFEPKVPTSAPGVYVPVEDECVGAHLTVIEGLGYEPQCRRCGAAVSLKTGKVLKKKVAVCDRMQQNRRTGA